MSNGKFPETPILHVDDEYRDLKSVKIRLSHKGINNIAQCPDSRQVIPMLEKQEYSLILLDLKMPYISGEELLPQIAEKFPYIPVVVVTGEKDTSTIVSCTKKGAFDYITKPIDDDRLVTIIKHALEIRKRQIEQRKLKETFSSDTLENPVIFKDIITRNSMMFKIFQLIEVVGPRLVPILITGETGTGKELIAKAIHNVSQVEGKLVPDNVTNWTKNLAGVSLFGSVKGAFTDAVNRGGRLKKAENGTIFLDEIGDLNLKVQPKILRLLQEGTYYPLGSDEEQKTNARFIFATNRDLNDMERRGEFRSDLLYRIDETHIHLLPLRERKEDIPLLVDHFVQKYASKFKIPKPEIPDTLYNILLNYRFPGNVRELENMVKSAMSSHRNGPLSIEEFVKKIREKGEEPVYNPPPPPPPTGQVTDHSILFGGDFPKHKKLMAVYTNEALRRTNGDKSKAARLSGLPRTTFARYWKKSNSPDTDKKKNKKN